MRAGGSGTQDVKQIDIGFPLDWRILRNGVSDDVEIMGGVEIPQ